MTSLRILIIPDVHQDFDFVNRIFEKEKDSCDQIIFLGDYFDTHKKEGQEVWGFRASCEYLKDLVLLSEGSDRMIFLLGNHDLKYIWHNNESSGRAVKIDAPYYCSGTTESKINKFRKVFFDRGLKDSFFQKNFRLAYQTQGWIFSHAGILSYHIPPFCESITTFIEQHVQEAWINFRDLQHKDNILISGCGRARGGYDQYGGLLWTDWNREFVPHTWNDNPFIGKQIMGHTKQHEPQIIYPGTDQECCCLDARQHYYGVIQNQKLEIHKV